jgi:hypothetical protein
LRGYLLYVTQGISPASDEGLSRAGRLSYALEIIERRHVFKNSYKGLVTHFFFKLIESGESIELMLLFKSIQSADSCCISRDKFAYDIQMSVFSASVRISNSFEAPAPIKNSIGLATVTDQLLTTKVQLKVGLPMSYPNFTLWHRKPYVQVSDLTGKTWTFCWSLVS